MSIYNLKYDDDLLLESIDNIFGSKNNMRYMRSFLGSEVIEKLLTCSKNAYRHSDEFKRFFGKLSRDEKFELLKSLGKACQKVDTLF